MASCSLSFASVGCNRLGNCASWSAGGVVYGASSFVGLYNPETFQVQTLRAHKDRVNCVKWIGEGEIVSGSTDSLLIVWKKGLDGVFTPAQKLQIHSSSITSLSTLTWEGKCLIVATSADKTISVWLRSCPTGEWELHQHGELAKEAVECCALHLLPNSQTPLLALGGVGGAGSCRGSEIHLYLPEYCDGTTKLRFHKVVTLKGHEDWIRCLSFVTCDDGTVLLASSAQDNFIRLWKLEVGGEEPAAVERTNDIFASLAMLDTVHSTSMSQQGHSFEYEEKRYSAILESVLYGHEDWVYSVDWHPPTITAEGKSHQPLCLLSASMDKTMMIWKPQEDQDGIWINEMRVGELGGITLGFYGGLFSPNGDRILAHGYNGAFHSWERSSVSQEGEKWTPIPSVSGHFAPVNDCSWDPSGNYFMTVSQDQTVRIFALWKRPEGDEVYCEVARPQIHGYDLECGGFIHGTSHRFVTGAEEKIYRVFDAPQSFLHNLGAISGMIQEDSSSEPRPLGANVASLGLSNKPVFAVEEAEVKEEKSESFEAPKPADPVFLTRPPFEEELLQSTLWPEIQKLYGHGNYAFCVTSSWSGDLLATAVRAKSDADQATIRLWETKTWKEVANLRAHKLTITQLRFSHSDLYLLSSGRDRQFSLFHRPALDQPFTLVAKQAKAHERIIWGCDWTPDDKYFVTASRDKLCKVWNVAESHQPILFGSFSPAKVGITAVAFAPLQVSLNNEDKEKVYLLAVGLENGLMQVWTFRKGSPEFSCLLHVPPKDCHASTVKRIDWQKPKEGTPLRFVSCSEDQSVRVFSLNI